MDAFWAPVRPLTFVNVSARLVTVFNLDGRPAGIVTTKRPTTALIETAWSSRRLLLAADVGLDFRAPAARSALEDMRMMEQAIEERRDSGGVAQQLALIVDRSV